MSNPTGFDYEVMISRLHGGLCAFQSLRAHRRERAQAAAPPPATEARRMPEPQPAARIALDDLAELHATASLDAAPPSAPAAAVAPATPPAPTADTRPPAPAATLRLPPPTPPPQLGLILGGRPATPEPSAVTEPPTAIRPQESDAPPTAVAASAASIAVLLDARAQEDAQRLERAHAEHHAAMATLLREHQEALRAQREADATRTTAHLRDVFAEHRAELRAQSEADAARTTALLRDVLAEHRAELAQANQAHTDPLAQALAQRSQSADHPTPELRAALLEQANVQREANEAVAENIDALTSIVADLGHTVGMLAVAATQKAQQAQRSVQAIFPPPPRVEPASAASPKIEPASAASPQVELAVVPGTPPHIEPAVVERTITRSPGAASACVRPATTASSDGVANQSSLTQRVSEEPARTRSIPLTLAQDAAELARVEEVLADDEDDGESVDDLPDDDDPERHRRLAPCTDIEGTAGEPGDD